MARERHDIETGIFIQNLKTHVNQSLRRNYLMRSIFTPFMRYKRRKELEKYRESDDSKIICKMNSSHIGERCFIVLNGPSLAIEDLDKIKNEYSFGCNRIYDIYDKTEWRPNIYMTIDKALLQSRTKQEWMKLKSSEIFCFWKKNKVPYEIKDQFHEIICWGKFRADKYDDVQEISRDVSQYFSITHSVSIPMLELAIYMGFKEIILIGCDHNFAIEINRAGQKIYHWDVKPHFVECKDKTIHASNKEALTESYRKVGEYAESVGIKIYNATRGGKLEVFERVNFDELF